MIKKGNIQEQMLLYPENRGWIIGSFVPTDSSLYSDNVEVKWVSHKEGENRTGSTSQYSKKSIDIVLHGKCRFSFPSHNQTFELSKGDYIVYDTSICTHNFESLSDCTLIVIRTPSKPVSSMPKNPTTLFEVPLYNGTYNDFFQKIEHPEKKTLVFTPNPEIFVRASRDSEFMEILKAATYNVPDANGLYIGYMMREGKSFFASALRTLFCKKSIRGEYGELIKGSDLTKDILEGGETVPKKILIIDKKNAVPKNNLERKKAEIQKDLKNILEAKYLGIEVFVVFDGELSISEIAKLIENQSIDFVFSCIGMKNQEKRLIEVFSHLKEDQKVVGLGVGASIDFLLGLQKRAPKVFQNLGLEWFYRLITQPRIRARRIWDAVYHFQKLIKNSSD